MAGVNPTYSQLLREIRPYVKFNFDLRSKLTPHEKAKITRYHRRLFGGISTSKDGEERTVRALVLPTKGKIYRPTSKRGRKALVNYVPELRGYPGMTAVPIDAKKSDRVRITKKGQIKIVGQFRGKTFVPVDDSEIKNALMWDTWDLLEVHFWDVLKPYPERENRIYTLQLIGGELGASTRDDKRRGVTDELVIGRGIGRSTREQVIDRAIELLKDNTGKYKTTEALLRGFNVYDLKNQEHTDFFERRKSRKRRVI